MILQVLKLGEKRVNKKLRFCTPALWHCTPNKIRLRCEGCGRTGTKRVSKFVFKPYMFLDADLYSSTPLKTSWFFFFALKSFNNFCRFFHVWTRCSRRLHNFLFCISRYFFFWSAKSHEPCLSLFPKVSFSPNFSYSCLL